VTNGVCDSCWGSGDEDRKWPSWRKYESLQAENTRLKAENERMRGALKFYEAEKNYDWDGPGTRMNVDVDRGDVAREALKESK